jgi:hypothetical protein
MLVVDRQSMLIASGVFRILAGAVIPEFVPQRAQLITHEPVQIVKTIRRLQDLSRR